MANRKTIKISRDKLVEVLQTIKGASFVTISMTGDVSFARKTNNPFFGRTTKTQTFNGILNYDYQGNVNRALEKQGETADFVASKPAWGTRVGDTCIIQHKGQTYFDIRVLRSLKTKYTFDGKAISKDEIRSWLKPSSPAQSGIVVRRPKIENIFAMNIMGLRYRIVG